METAYGDENDLAKWQLILGTVLENPSERPSDDNDGNADNAESQWAQ